MSIIFNLVIRMPKLKDYTVIKITQYVIVITVDSVIILGDTSDVSHVVITMTTISSNLTFSKAVILKQQCPILQ